MGDQKCIRTVQVWLELAQKNYDDHRLEYLISMCKNYIETRQTGNPRKINDYIVALGQMVINVDSFKKVMTNNPHLAKQSELQKGQLITLLADVAKMVRKARFHLEELQGFYKKNLGRVEHGKIEIREKKDSEYPIYKRLTAKGGGQNVFGQRPSYLGEKLQYHLKRELGNNRKGFLNFLRNEFQDVGITGLKIGNAAEMATKYALVNDLSLKALSGHCRISDLPDARDYHKLIIKDGLIYGYYTLKLLKNGQNKAYPGDDEKSPYLPSLQPLHTLTTPVQVDNKSVVFKSRETLDVNAGIGEMRQSLKYTMRKNAIYIEPDTRQKRVHAEAVDYKSVQSAGGIMGRGGKVVAIDNMSGHYRPGWQLLSQVVHLLEKNVVMDTSGVVGMLGEFEDTASKKQVNMFFPREVFHKLAEGNFKYKVMKKIARRYRDSKPPKFGAGIGDFFRHWWWLGENKEQHKVLCEYWKNHKR